MAAIHEKLKTMREKAGLRQGQLADYLGVSRTFMSQVETGERSLTVDQLESVVNLYAAFADMVENALPTPAQEISPEDLRSIADIGNHVFRLQESGKGKQKVRI